MNSPEAGQRGIGKPRKTSFTGGRVFLFPVAAAVRKSGNETRNEPSSSIPASWNEFDPNDGENYFMVNQKEIIMAELVTLDVKDEYNSLRSQFGALKRGQHTKYPPYAFTEQGVAMLSSVLDSKLAAQINIQIMRAFVRIRNLIADNTELRKAIENIEKRLDGHDRQIQLSFAALKNLLQPPPQTTPQQLPPKEHSPGKERKMGFGKDTGKRDAR